MLSAGARLLGVKKLRASLVEQLERLYAVAAVVVVVVLQLVDHLFEVPANAPDVLVAMLLVALPRLGRPVRIRRHRLHGYGPGRHCECSSRGCQDAAQSRRGGYEGLAFHVFVDLLLDCRVALGHYGLVLPSCARPLQGGTAELRSATTGRLPSCARPLQGDCRAALGHYGQWRDSICRRPIARRQEVACEPGRAVGALVRGGRRSRGCRAPARRSPFRGAGEHAGCSRCYAARCAATAWTSRWDSAPSSARVRPRSALRVQQSRLSGCRSVPPRRI